MNYQLHYDRLIARAQARVLDGYVERHHILPRCLGGTDEVTNLVQLTPEEHFIAHVLLVKIHPGNVKLVFAVHALLMSGRTKTRSKNKEVGWLRRLNAEAIRQRRLGVRHTEEAKAKMSRGHKGKVLSEETKAKMSASAKGRVFTSEHKAALSAAGKGKTGNATGCKRSEETKRKMSVARQKWWDARNAPN